MAQAWRGKVALVTGASQGGTGTALARRLAAEGAMVALVARDRKGLEETLDEVVAAGSTGSCYGATKAALADPVTLTGRIAYSLPLLVEFDVVVRDLAGTDLVAGWQPKDLPEIMKAQDDYKRTWQFTPNT